MDDLEWMLFVDSIVWYGSMVVPLVLGALWSYFIFQRKNSESDFSPLRLVLCGVFVIWFISALGSIAVGQQMLDGLRGGPPLYLVEQTWLRMWYPLGFGFVAASVVAFLGIRSIKGTA